MMRLAVIGLALLVAACGEDMGTDAGPGTDSGPGEVDSGPGSDAGTDAGGEADAGPPGDDAGADAGDVMSIPGCGVGTDDWGFGVMDVGVPSDARPIGTISMSPGYIEATLDAISGDAFYAFCTPADWSGDFDVNLFAAPGIIDYVHVHDGDGMVFGPEITPSASTMTSGTWSLLPDHLYVLEVHGSMGSFF